MILPSEFGRAELFGVAAVAAYTTAGLPLQAISGKSLRAVLALAWALHALQLLLNLSAPWPRFGFAPALSVTAWLALTIYGIERRLFPDLQARRVPAALGAMAVLLALVFPGAALRNHLTPWFALHLALGVASYGLFAAAVIHAALMQHTERLMRLATGNQAGVPLLTLERLTFQFVGAGFLLLTATLLMGWWFSESIHGAGQVWRWDHKTVFSLLSWLVFAVLLVGRARFGWRGRVAVRTLYTGAGLLLLGYVGSRFVLEVILRRGL